MNRRMGRTSCLISCRDCRPISILGAWRRYLEAVDILAYNVRLYPISPNTCDSLAEACFKKGDKENAARYYRLAIERNPGNSNFEKRLLQSSKAKLKELSVEMN